MSIQIGPSPSSSPPSISGSLVCSGMIIPRGWVAPIVEDAYIEMGNKVLRHVNAHETSRLGELSDAIRQKLQYLKDTASFTNDQWKAFASLNESISEMIGDPYEPNSNTDLSSDA